MKKLKRVLVGLTACLFLFPAAIFNGFAQEEIGRSLTEADPTGNTDSYFHYLKKYKENTTGTELFSFDKSNLLAAAAPDQTVKSLETEKGEIDGLFLSAKNNAWTEWKLTVPSDGLYTAYITYYPLEGLGKNFELSFLIDGMLPFSEASNIQLPRIWTDEVPEGEEFRKDAAGNDIRPSHVEAPRLVTKPMRDTQGLYNEPYQFYFSAGEHTIRLESQLEDILIQKIVLAGLEEPVSYQEYQQLHPGELVKGNKTIVLQAERAFEKTSPSLYPQEDRSTVATTPNDPSRQRLNTIGGSTWIFPGDMLTWRIEVPVTGYYHLSFRVRQNMNEGLISYRTLYINEEVPFQEVKAIEFPYSDDWYVKTIEQPIYLESGKKNTISLECTPGKMSDILSEINQIVLDMNGLYRKIIVITGSNPDTYRDYRLKEEIPELIPSLEDITRRLKSVSVKIKELLGNKGSQASIVDEVIILLEDMLKRPHIISTRLGKYKENVESLAAIIFMIGEQPLELDALAVVPENGEELRGRAGFFEDFWFECQKFFLSFVSDYNAIGSISDSGKVVKVWMSSGRDQAQILKRMIDDLFTPQYQIHINLNIVDQGNVQSGNILVQSIMAGRGPDVAVMIPKETPINLAIRGALIDLSDEKYGLDDIQDDFYESAWLPYQIQGGTYAIPETQIFEMMFYRTDIFEELNLAVPETWDDFYHVLRVLQNNNLQVGISEMDAVNPGVSLGISTFTKFLFQNGGKYYTDNLSATRFDEEVALDAFEQWVELYTKYGLDRQFDFFNRFRAGEMPLGIGGYNIYNQLSVAAPELKGLWKMVPIPGVKREDGTINRAQSATSTGCVMIKSAEEKGIAQEAFTFMKWWTGAEAQTRYANDLENLMGVAARYTPAHKEVLNKLGWTSSEIKLLEDSWREVIEMEQIPGNYEVSRSLTNAMRSSIENNSNPRRELTIYNDDINREIKRKREEFHMD